MTTAATDRLNADIAGDNGAMGSESPLAVLNRSEIDMQIATAKRYPRSIARAKQKMIETATTDEETAQGCIYTLKRRDAQTGEDNFIKGPSVRLAEIAVYAWGNIRAGARIIGEDGNFIVAQGVCHDLENNTFTSIEVRRRITGRNGRKYSDDMIGVTANAASAIAFRNAVYKIVPKVFVNAAYEAARKLVAGDAKSLAERRQASVGWWASVHGISLPRLLEYLDKPDKGIEDITGDDLATLHGVATAIRDGETSLDEQFPPLPPKGKAVATGAGGLNAALDAEKQQTKAATAPAQSSPSPATQQSIFADTTAAPATNTAPQGAPVGGLNQGAGEGNVSPPGTPSPESAAGAVPPAPVKQPQAAPQAAQVAKAQKADTNAAADFPAFKARVFAAMAARGMPDNAKARAWNGQLLKSRCIGKESKLPQAEWEGIEKTARDGVKPFDWVAPSAAPAEAEPMLPGTLPPEPEPVLAPGELSPDEIAAEEAAEREAMKDQ